MTGGFSMAQVLSDKFLGTRQEKCKIHGDYESTGIRWTDREVWSPCTQCLDIANKAIVAEGAQRAEIDRRERQLKNAFGCASIPRRYENKTFDTYFADTEPKRRALAICREFAEQFEVNEQHGPSLILCGRPGTGKTHLACSIADFLIRNGKSAVFTHAFDAVRTIKATWSRKSEITEAEAIRSFINPDLLILDEIGVQFGSEAEMLFLFEIINGRYEAIKPTIILSNLPIGELKSFIGERVVDRLREGGGKYIALDWESFRAQA